MSRAYIVTRNGGTVTKAPINDNKIPIYDNETALDADLANIPDNTLVATKGGHDDVIDQMKAYIRDQNELSNYESISLPATQETAITMRYDGVLFLYDNLNYSAGIRISQDGGVSWKGLNATSGYNQFMFELIFNKGDMIYMGQSNRNAYVAYYKKRDYSNRQ